VRRGCYIELYQRHDLIALDGGDSRGDFVPGSVFHPAIVESDPGLATKNDAASGKAN
jgi:hypothetical protein